MSSHYWAYISYSHKDEKWAKWLHDAIETYQVPRQLIGKKTNGQIIPNRLIPIFRDRTELPSSSDLGDVLDKALRESKFMIVLCSPSAAGSQWVNEEILRFKRLGKESRILALIIDGDPNAGECFPDSLIHRLNESGDLTPEIIEPIAADVRPNQDGKSNAKLKLISGMLSVGFDELKQRDLQRKYFRMMALTAFAVVITLITSSLSIYAFLKSRDAERRRDQSEELIGFMLGDLQDKLSQVGSLELLDSVGDQALDYFVSLEETDITDETLAKRAKAMRLIGDIRISQGRLPDGIVAFEESLLLDRELLSRNPNDANQIYNIAQSHYWVGYANWRTGNLEFADKNFQLYLQFAAQLVQLDATNDEWQMELSYAFSNLGTLAIAKGDYEHALSHFSRSANIIEDLMKVKPSDPNLMYELGSLISWLGSANQYSGNLTEAKDLFHEQVSMAQQLVKLDADNTIWQVNLANALILFGNSQLMIGGVAGATRSFTQARKLAANLTKRDPENRLWQSLRARSEMHHGITLLSENGNRDALSYFETSVDINRELTMVDAKQRIWQMQFAESLLFLSIAQQNRGDFIASMATAQEAGNIFDYRTDAYDTSELRWKLLSARSALQLGRAYSVLDEKESAIREWQVAYDILYPISRESLDLRVLDPLFEVTTYLGRTSIAEETAKLLLKMEYRNPLFLAKCGDLCFAT